MNNKRDMRRDIKKIKLMINKAEWLGLQHLINSISQENLVETQKLLISKILRVTSDQVSNFWPSGFMPFYEILKIWLDTTTFESIPVEIFYDFLLKNSYIAHDEFSRHYIESFNKNTLAMYNLYSSELFLNIYSYLRKYNLYSESPEKIQITITLGTPNIQDDNKYSNPFYKKCKFLVENNQNIANKTKRSDNLFIIGRNASSQLIDADFYSNGHSEEAMCLITVNPYQLTFVDFDLKDHSGIRIIDPIPLKKNQVFRLGYFAIISVMNIRNKRDPMIQIKSYVDVVKEFTIKDLDEEFQIGKQGKPQAWDISTLSRKHCKIWYEHNLKVWMIGEICNSNQEGPINGTWLLFKNRNQYENNCVSSPVHIDRSNPAVLIIGRQICFVNVVGS